MAEEEQEEVTSSGIGDLSLPILQRVCAFLNDGEAREAALICKLESQENEENATLRETSFARRFARDSSNVPYFS